jgi:hypothetical protein
MVASPRQADRRIFIAIAFREQRIEFIRFWKRFEKRGSLSMVECLQSGLPSLHCGGQPIPQLGEFVKVLRCQLSDLSTWNSASASLLEYVGKLREGESHSNGASDHLDVRQRFRRVESVTGLAARWHWEQTELFVMTQRIRADACSTGKFTRP